MSKEKIIYQNTLAHLAQEEIELARDQTTVENIDRTETLLNEINSMIIRKRKIDISIHGRVRTGKSTLGLALAKHIIEQIMIPLKLTTQKMKVKNVVRDQTEFSKLMRTTKETNTLIVIDEWRELEESGENITIEKALRQDINEVQAWRYVHTIWISPREINEDNQSEIILETIPDGINRQQKTISARLYYNQYRGGITQPILIGHITIKAGTLLKNWLKIEDIFYKNNRTPKEEETIGNMRKKDWYTEYYIKKTQKTKVMLNQGIYNTRLLEYDPVIYATVQKLKRITELSGKIKKDLIIGYITEEYEEQKIPVGEYGILRTLGKVTAILGLYKDRAQIKKDIKKETDKMEGKPGATNLQNEYIRTLKEHLRETNEKITKMEERLQKRIETKRELERIDST